MIEAIFWGVVAFHSVSLASHVFSILRPALRVWPPAEPGERGFRIRTIVARLNFLCLFPSALGFFALAVLDAGSFVFDHPARFVVGGLAIAAGGAFALWGYLGLGVRTSQGHLGELATTGAYRYSRNPQYVGTVAALLGVAAISNSILCGAVGLLWAVGFLLMPFAEEPWLRAKLGEPYERYAKRTPRYLGLARKAA